MDADMEGINAAPAIPDPDSLNRGMAG